MTKKKISKGKSGTGWIAQSQTEATVFNFFSIFKAFFKAFFKTQWGKEKSTLSNVRKIKVNLLVDTS